MRQTKADRTRQFIIEQTASIFNTKGYAGTSINDLTEATKLTRGSIYGNFESKEDVALAAFDHNYAKVYDLIRNEMLKRDTWQDKLMVYYEVYSNHSQYSFPVGGCPVLNTATEADDTNAPLRARAIDAIKTWKRNIEKIIDKGVKAGEFRKDTNAPETALAIIAAIEGASMIANLTGEHSYRASIMKTVKKIITDIFV